MARAIWSGNLSFGLVNVPVKLYGATSPKTVRFNQLNGKTGARVKQQRVDAVTGDEVAYEDITKGYEISPDRYVTITAEELDSVVPKKVKSIELEEFVQGDEIDPLAFASGYYLAPEAGASKAYRLLVDSMGASGKVGIGRVILRSKEALVAVRSQDGVLVCSTLMWADEINQPSMVELTDDEPSEADVKMAGALIDALTVEFDHGKFEDEYRNALLAMVEAKAAGEVIEMPAEEKAAAPTPDLMAGLEASLAAVKAKKPAAKKTAAKAKVSA